LKAAASSLTLFLLLNDAVVPNPSFAILSQADQFTSPTQANQVPADRQQTTKKQLARWLNPISHQRSLSFIFSRRNLHH